MLTPNTDGDLLRWRAGGGWYGVPSYYTEYQAELGQAVADPIRVFPSSSGGDNGDDGDGKEEVWTREFEHGFAVVSSLSSSNFSVKIGGGKGNVGSAGAAGLRPLPLSKEPERLTDQREAPAWQFVIDNDLRSVPAPLRATARARALEARASASPRGKEDGAACVCSAAAPACCTHAAGTPADWWVDDARRAGFRVAQGKWTTVTDSSESHQVGNSFAVSFIEPGPLPQGLPPAMEAVFHFVAPSTDTFNFAMTAVDAHFYPLTNGESSNMSPRRVAPRAAY